MIERGAALARLVAGAAGTALLASTPVGAQRPSGAQGELRLDVIAASTPSVQIGAGVNVPAGLYVRLGGTVAAGFANRDGTTHGAARGEVITRFLLDPFAESPHALYGLGGISAMVDPFEQWRPRVVVGLGIESRVRNRRAVAAELSLGGGVRLGFAIRRGRTFGR